MSRIGVSSNLIQPNSNCLSCKYWEPTRKEFGMVLGGHCTAGYCKQNILKGGRKK